MKNFPPFCLFGESQTHKTSDFIYDRQPVLFVPSPFFITIDEWESCHKSYSQPKLPVELSVNKALSACHVCPRLTHLFPAGHFVTSSTLCTNQSIASCFMVAHMYVGLDFFCTQTLSRTVVSCFWIIWIFWPMELKINKLREGRARHVCYVPSV